MSAHLYKLGGSGGGAPQEEVRHAGPPRRVVLRKAVADCGEGVATHAVHHLCQHLQGEAVPAADAAHALACVTVAVVSDFRPVCAPADTAHLLACATHAVINDDCICQ